MRENIQQCSRKKKFFTSLMMRVSCEDCNNKTRVSLGYWGLKVFLMKWTFWTIILCFTFLKSSSYFFLFFIFIISLTHSTRIHFKTFRQSTNRDRHSREEAWLLLIANAFRALLIIFSSELNISNSFSFLFLSLHNSFKSTM